MNDLSHVHLHQDDQLLVDYLTGQIDDDARAQVARRLTDDSEFAARAAKLNQLLMVMDACPSESPSELLISRTLAAVGSESSAASLRRGFQFGSSGSMPFGLREFAAVAALVFIVATILMPVINHSRRLYIQQVCQSHAGEAIGSGLAQYAQDNNGSLPATADMNAGWLRGAPTERTVSNSSNLWKMVPLGYVEPKAFRCPAVERAGRIAESDYKQLEDFPGPDHIDYSYQNAVNAVPPSMDTSTLAASVAILADRSPLFEDGHFEPARLSLKNSPNHGHRGQVVLYLDGHSDWFDHADVGVNGDNIWLVKDVVNYRGDERPAGRADSFLLPSFVSQK